MGFALASLGQLFGGHSPARGDEPLTGGLALYGTFATKDGKYVTLGALEPKFWMAFCTGVGIDVDHAALLPGVHQAGPEGQAPRRLRVAYARRVAGVRPPARLLPRAGARAGRAARRRAPPRARDVLRDGLAWGRIAQLRTPLAERGATHAPPPKQGEHHRRHPRRSWPRRCGHRRHARRRGRPPGLGRVDHTPQPPEGRLDLAELLDELPVGDESLAQHDRQPAPRTSPPTAAPRRGSRSRRPREPPRAARSRDPAPSADR